jgi:hypothetical protein
MEVLNVIFHGKCIGRGGSILWPFRSPRLTVLDVFFWGYIKNCVNMDKI